MTSSVVSSSSSSSSFCVGESHREDEFDSSDDHLSKSGKQKYPWTSSDEVGVVGDCECESRLALFLLMVLPRRTCPGATGLGERGTGETKMFLEVMEIPLEAMVFNKESRQEKKKKNNNKLIEEYKNKVLLC